MSTPASFDVGVANQIGRYADAVRIPAGYDQILLSGTPGLAPDGSLAEDITGQATQAWRNVEAALTAAGAGIGDVVAARQWLTDAADIPAYVAVRAQFVGNNVASMLAVVPGLIRPGIRVEIEVVAAVRGA